MKEKSDRRWKVDLIIQSVPGPVETRWKKQEMYVDVPRDWTVDEVMSRSLQALLKVARQK